MLKRISKMEANHQIIFAIVLAISMISFWRGVSGLLGIYVFPNNIKLSLWTSLAIGISVLVLTNYITNVFSLKKKR